MIAFHGNCHRLRETGIVLIEARDASGPGSAHLSDVSAFELWVLLAGALLK